MFKFIKSIRDHIEYRKFIKSARLEPEGERMLAYFEDTFTGLNSGSIPEYEKIIDDLMESTNTPPEQRHQLYGYMALILKDIKRYGK